MSIGEYIEKHAMSYDIQEACERICYAYGISLEEECDSYSLTSGAYHNRTWLSIESIIDIVLGEE